MNNTIVHKTSETSSHLVDLFAFQGAPENLDAKRKVEILVNHGYAVGYSPSRLQPVWSAYRVAGFKKDMSFDRPHVYYADTRLLPEFRVSTDTFGKINDVQYHVGHMVPNEVINRQFGRLAQMETFFMSNMSPQRGSLNTGLWLKLENSIRNIEDTPERDHVWAICGPVFGDSPTSVEREDGKKIPIAEAFYCVLADPIKWPWSRPSDVIVDCFIIPQEAKSSDDIVDYKVPITEVEDLTKLKFFPGWGRGASKETEFPAEFVHLRAGAPASRIMEIIG